MVLISTENLERMQRMQQQPEIVSITMTDNSPKKNTEISSAENVNNNNNSVRTPGTALSRLDAEMWRILNLATPVDEDKRWKLYKEVLQRYLHFVQEAKKRLREDTQGNGEDINDEQNEDTNLDVDDNEFMETSTLISSGRGDGSASSSSSSFGKKRAQSAEMIKKILDSVPKSYRDKARALLKYLIDIPSSKISWDRRGLVTIDGSVITGSNISELINDAIRERKTVKATGRIQFARLLRDIGTPSNLIGNRDLLHTYARSQRIKIVVPRGSSTPRTSTERSKSYRRKVDETSETEGDTLFVSADEDEGDKTVTSYADFPTKKRKKLLDWSKLE